MKVWQKKSTEELRWSNINRVEGSEHHLATFLHIPGLGVFMRETVVATKRQGLLGGSNFFCGVVRVGWELDLSFLGAFPSNLATLRLHSKLCSPLCIAWKNAHLNKC